MDDITKALLRRVADRIDQFDDYAEWAECRVHMEPLPQGEYLSYLTEGAREEIDGSTFVHPTQVVLDTLGNGDPTEYDEPERIKLATALLRLPDAIHLLKPVGEHHSTPCCPWDEDLAVDAADAFRQVADGCDPYDAWKGTS